MEADFSCLTKLRAVLVAYQQFNDGTMTDYIPTDEDLAEAIKCVPPQPAE